MLWMAKATIMDTVAPMITMLNFKTLQFLQVLTQNSLSVLLLKSYFLR